jgi:lambda repressor-like predicted transcriptional regulator
MTERRTGDERRTEPRPGGGRRHSDRARVIAQRVAEELRVRQITVYRLSKWAEVDERTIRNVLDGKDANLHTLECIAHALGLELTELVALPDMRI